MNCLDCKESMLPQDPSVSFGGFRPLCYSCPDFDYRKEVLEKSVFRFDVPEMGTHVPEMGLTPPTRIINITQHIHIEKSKRKADRL